jgi:hypothetical protein
METQETLEHPNVKKAIDHLNSVLIEGETVNSWSIQRRLFALTHRRVLIGATSGRFIVIKRGLFGGYTMHDLRWQDLGDIQLHVGIFGADLHLKLYSRSDLASSRRPVQIVLYSGFRKEQAQNIYRLSQTQEQAWREKRRIRELEELRAKSGGFNVGAFQDSQTAITQSDDSVTRLKKAKDMLDNKLITDSEYESIKAKIINQL